MTPRRPLGVLAAAAALAAVLGACSPGQPAPTLAPLATHGAGSAPAGSLTVDSPQEGVVIAIDAEGFTDVRAFTLRRDDGTELAFAMGPLENATEFPPAHLAEHLAASTKVRVFFRDEAGARTAYRIEDVTTP